MRAKVLTECELERVLERCDAQEAVVILAGHRAGLRACEIAAFDWSMVRDASGGLADHIDLPAVATKGRTGRGRVPLAPDLHRALLRLSAYRRHSRKGSVILGANGTGLSAHAVAQRVGRLYRAAGLAGASSHSGRRTYANRLAANLSLSSLQVAMRHANASTTLIYVDAQSDDVIAGAVRSLGA